MMGRGEVPHAFRLRAPAWEDGSGGSGGGSLNGVFNSGINNLHDLRARLVSVSH